MRHVFRSVALSFLIAGAAHASGDALIFRADSEARTIRSNMSAAANALGRQDIDIVMRSGADANALRAGLSDFIDNLDARTETALVILTGSFAHTATGSYYLPRGANGTNLTSVLTEALPLDAVMAVLAGFPGRAVLVLAPDEETGRSAALVRLGLGDLDIPQGVTVISGNLEYVAPFAARDLSRPGVRLITSARSRGLEVQGYAPTGMTLFEEPMPVIVPPTPLKTPKPQNAPATSTAADQAFWGRVTKRDSVEGYEDYLETFPLGLHAATARQRIAAIKAEPFRDERLAEEALKLKREARRDIQRDLSLLEYNTRGIDGIFGKGSRAAIQKWQSKNGFAVSGYLNNEQITRLDAQAERRAAELEEEARRKQAEQERLDRAYWEETGSHDDVAGLRAYLKRYPDGVFAEVAQDRLYLIEEDLRSQAAEQDLNVWNQVVQEDTLEAYQAYQNQYPNGAFADQAAARIDALSMSDQERQLLARAEAQEKALRMNRGARQLAEQKLRQLDLKPGDVDGVFDDRTRRAIRRYQDARGLTVTGYLDQNTVVRLLADSLLR